MLDNLTQFINKLRESDDAAKKRWLIIFTAPTMLLILVVWLMMLSSSLALRDEVEQKSNFAQSWEVFKRGVSVIAERLKEGGSIFGATLNERLLRIEEVPSDNLKFNYGELEEISPKKLNK